jgi:ribonuclease HII
MTWIIGIDEAGYGPNLGPLVMTSVACRVPDRLAGADLWQLFSESVRRADDPNDGRILIDDSKLVYSPARGLQALERGVHAVPGLCEQGDLDGWLATRCVEGHADLCDEPWYRGDTTLPACEGWEESGEAFSRFGAACVARRVTTWRARFVVLCPPRFNTLADTAMSKGAVLAHALARLLRHCEAATVDGEPVRIFVDKHGGRNTYAAIVQHGLDRGLVVALEEGMDRSAYCVHEEGCDIQLVFQPRADGAHLCVALASMASKYVRELCMGEFNRFWRRHVPGLKATAGYPGDAARFWDAIRPTAMKLGLSDSQTWRSR